jgi:hypothetical protein
VVSHQLIDQWRVRLADWQRRLDEGRPRPWLARAYVRVLSYLLAQYGRASEDEEPHGDADSMAKPRVQFGTKAFLGVISLVAVALGALRQIYEVVAFHPAYSGTRLIVAVCIICGCCFGISGFVVGWPIHGFLFGLACGALAILAVLYMSAQIFFLFGLACGALAILVILYISAQI